jgi:hypothetical protein
MAIVMARLSPVNPPLPQTSAFGIATFGKINTTPFCRFILKIAMNLKLHFAQKSIKWPPPQGTAGQS